AKGVLAKPIQDRETLERTLDQIKQFVGRSAKDLLVVTADPEKGGRIGEIIGNGDIQTTTVTSGQEALALLHKRRSDCLVLAPKLPDMSAVITGLTATQRGTRDGALSVESQLNDPPELGNCPVIVYADQDSSGEEEYALNALTQSLNLKVVHSPERLLDQT